MRLPARQYLSIRSIIAAIVGAAMLLSTAAIAGAETPDQLREKRKQVQAEEAAAAEDVDIAADDAADVQAALDAIQQDVDAQAAAVEAARRGVQQAQRANSAAHARIISLQLELQEATERMQEQAVEAYVSFQGPASELAILDGDPWQQARLSSLVAFATGSNLDALDQLRSIKAELESENRQAEESRAEAQQKSDELELRLASLADARNRQASILDEANQRLNQKLAELAALEDVDAQLATDIRNEEQRIADAIADRNSPSSGSYVIPDDLKVDLTTVRGITVNVIIADQLEGLLAAMAAKGYTLGGGGYRSPSRQIALRRQHCGTSEYAIWRMPASRCRPPTAPPGKSAHEKGLAIDFTYNNRALRSRRSDIYKTLAALAPKFGFKNLPSEPWHWSVNGT